MATQSLQPVGFIIEAGQFIVASSSVNLMPPTRDTRQLTWVLAWAVVFCDIGTSVTLIGMLVAIGVRRAWFIEALTQIPFIERLQARAYRASEDLVEDELKGLMTLAEAIEVRPLYSSSLYWRSVMKIRA